MIHIKEKIGSYAILTGFLHEPDPEMDNIETYPVILVLPGGGFRICSSREAEPVALSYFAQGYSAFILDYTTVTKKPDAKMSDPMNDVQEALRRISEHRKEWHLSEHQTAVIGFSGGGHLAAACATHGPLRPDALLLIYPGIVHNPSRALDCPDIVESVDSHTPPCFIIGTRADTVTPPKHQLALARALEAAGVDFELHIFPGGIHGMSLGTSQTCSGNAGYVDPVYAEWFPMSVRWLKQQLGDFIIYGKNDGRNGRYHIDCTLADLFSSEKSAATVRKFLPAAAEAAKNSAAKDITLRNLGKYLPGVSPELMKQLDEELLRL